MRSPQVATSSASSYSGCLSSLEHFDGVLDLKSQSLVSRDLAEFPTLHVAVGIELLTARRSPKATVPGRHPGRGAPATRYPAAGLSAIEGRTWTGPLRR